MRPKLFPHTIYSISSTHLHRKPGVLSPLYRILFSAPFIDHFMYGTQALVHSYLSLLYTIMARNIEKWYWEATVF